MEFFLMKKMPYQSSSSREVSPSSVELSDTIQGHLLRIVFQGLISVSPPGPYFPDSS